MCFQQARYRQYTQINHGLIRTSWIDRPPSNLGEKAHGKLKADYWFILFTILLVFCLPEFWLMDNTTLSLQLLDNFAALVGCTNILFNYTASSNSAKIFANMYRSYRHSLSELFPNSGLVPNHHYALHLPWLMELLGPLIRLSEYAGETSCLCGTDVLARRCHCIETVSSDSSAGHIRPCCSLGRLSRKHRVLVVFVMYL